MFFSFTEMGKGEADDGCGFMKSIVKRVNIAKCIEAMASERDGKKDFLLGFWKRNHRMRGEGIRAFFSSFFVPLFIICTHICIL